MQSFDRRSVLAYALQAGGLELVSRSASGASFDATTPTDLLSRMEWLNPPPSFEVKAGRLTVRSSAKADFYRSPAWAIDNGNFFRLSVAGDFSFEARISPRLFTRFDQAGLMMRLDSDNWVKCGCEQVAGKRLASVVVTRGFSDWSTMPDLSQSAPVWWRLIRKKDSVQALCSLDGKDFRLVRDGYFAAVPQVEMGLLCASTEGTGVAASFDSVKLSPA